MIDFIYNASREETIAVDSDRCELIWRGDHPQRRGIAQAVLELYRFPLGFGRRVYFSVSQSPLETRHASFITSMECATYLQMIGKEASWIVERLGLRTYPIEENRTKPALKKRKQGWS